MTKLLRSLVLGGAMLGLAAGGMTVAQEKTKSAQKKDEKKDEKKSEAKFEIYKNKTGEFRFRVFGKDGKQLAMSTKGYEKREDAVAVIKAIQEMASAPIVDEK